MRALHASLATLAIAATILVCYVPDWPSNCQGRCQAEYTQCACRCGAGGGYDTCYRACSDAYDACVTGCGGG